ncbi:MAG: hypothetical protein K2I03_03590 [Lachnospiraceae bacterium]|nr:hypothetical protein [Lachnospiraceae bacterium]MDE6251213.1 hypothetical protein [Lachnospiraceae bacterium]
MLGKIIKHEFKATYKVYLLLFISLFTITALNKTTEYVPLDNTIWNIIKMFLFVAWIILLMFMVMGAMLLAVVRFYKTMVKDEGYLTHTLPVKKSQLIIGKFITSLIWMIVSFIMLIISIFLAYMSTGFMHDIINIMNEFANLLSDNPEIIIHIVLVLIMLISSCGASIFQFYASISLGQMFGRKLAGSVLFYFVINYAISILSTITMFIVPDFVERMNETAGLSTYDMMTQEGIVFDEFMIMMIIWQIICMAVCYFITNYRFSKKLNLE